MKPMACPNTNVMAARRRGTARAEAVGRGGPGCPGAGLRALRVHALRSIDVAVRAVLSVGAVLAWLATVQPCAAESARKTVAQGNQAYVAGEFDKALAAYDKASVDLPEAPELYFNKGAVYYKQGELDKAREAFKTAGTKTREPRVEAKTKYNLGNCAFQECERQKDSDPKKALTACEESIALYQEALKLDPQIPEAARNIEVVRLRMKALLDELRKKEEEAAKQKEQQQKNLDQLKKLIEKQEKAAGRNQDLQKQQGQGPSQAAAVAQKTQELAKDQRDLRQETEKVTDELTKQPQAQQPPSPPSQPQAQGPQPPTPQDQAKQHLDQAMSEQDKASDRLEQKRLKDAQPNQNQATEELKKALEALSQPQQQEGQQQEQQQQQGQEQQQEGEQQQQQEQQEKNQEQQQAQQQGEQRDKQDRNDEEKQAAMVNEEARDILNEEKENRDKRQAVPMSGYRAVDRDW
ncbi:MAG: hypothetical protein A3K19_21560 [Lentisphaerae bacterium RIFOXYB12_FULL_65_16]|nr:MAG: hypothetical protein A3K18_20810 [Lentisphaerae bacterium RIFOXYA12_64_32]OGV93856.1 MAG: hypothetical protein A3K19_21560 [Lentisphaerae bacterium RIFOXYB12_FULL_65_16]